MSESRDRGWRRLKTKTKSRKGIAVSDKQWISEKNWKLMYTRAEKLRRARQLAIEYPKRTVRQTLDDEQPSDE